MLAASVDRVASNAHLNGQKGPIGSTEPRQLRRENPSSELLKFLLALLSQARASTQKEEPPGT
jgi:hypothetical protein